MEFITVFNILKKGLKLIYDIAGLCIIWIIIHYAAANLYSTYCAEFTVIGFVKSMFVAQEPHCVAMRWVIYNGGNMINSMWLSIAVWLTTKLFNNLVL
jgi:hypothetical protein